MTKKELRIVYMGTPDFAVESLKALVEGGYQVVGVITMPDKASGRGHKLQYSAVKEYARSQDLPLLQPEKLKDPEFLKVLRAWKADLQIVVAFRMLPEVVWDMPRLGTFNLHASLLPQYRGAAPINWAVINGEKETGITTFFLTHEIDTGKIIMQEKIAIAETENVGSVHDRLMHLGAELVVKTVDAIIDERVNAIDQDKFFKNESELKSAPKIFKETCRIDWSHESGSIHNFVRGLSPHPGAWSELIAPDGTVTVVKVFECEPISEEYLLPAGTIRTNGKSILEVATGNGFIRILSLQLAGKKRMDLQSLMNGYPITDLFTMR